MNSIVRKTSKQNILNLLGKLSIGGEGSTLFGGTIGAGIGASLFGVPGAIAVPIIGIVSKKHANRLISRSADYADQVIRAGKNAEHIADAYMKNTPKNLRKPDELSQLLMRSDINLQNLPEIDFFKRARNITLERRSALAAVLATPTTDETNTQENITP